MLLFERLPLAWWEADPDLRVTAHGGRTALDALGVDDLGVAAPEAMQFLQDRGQAPAGDVVMQAYALEGRTVRWRARVGGRSFDVVAGPRRDAAGRIDGVCGVAVDVTDGAQECERYAAFAAYLPAAAFVRDAGERYVWVNDAYAHLYARRPSEMVGRTLEEVVAGDDVVRFRSLDREVIARSQPMRHRVSFLRPDGVVGQAVGHRFPLQSSLGPCVGGVYVDVTDHFQALEHKALFEEDLRALRDRSGAASMTLCVNGRIERASVGAAELFGMSVTDLEAGDVRDFLAPLPRAEGERLLAAWRALARGRATSKRLWLRCRTASGALRLLRVDVAVARVPGRRVRLLTLMVAVSAQHSVVPDLAPVHKRVLVGLARGESNAAISRELGVTRQALDYHLQRLRMLLDAPSRSAVVARGYALGLLDASQWPPALTGRPGRSGGVSG
ncbi:PAS domain-containing protein [Streptomyces sp. NPDC048191]|uniref:PAS domain-containing protein n=1 Tax=Streptomyces sp. NPDC048191 TaxID=3155484 RepID=UPI0033F7C91F